MWAPTHGCALPLPKRHPNRCGVKQHGPKPSPHFRTIQKDDFLLFIYLNGGADAVADFLLARLDIGMPVGEVEAAVKLVKQCQSWAEGKGGKGGRPGFVMDLVKDFEQRAAAEAKAAEKAWQIKRQQLMQRDEERRRLDPREELKRRLAASPKPTAVTLQRERLERQVKEPSARREPTAARMRKAWWRHYQQQRRRTAGAMA